MLDASLHHLFFDTSDTLHTNVCQCARPHAASLAAALKCRRLHLERQRTKGAAENKHGCAGGCPRHNCHSGLPPSATPIGTTEPAGAEEAWKSAGLHQKPKSTTSKVHWRADPETSLPLALGPGPKAPWLQRAHMTIATPRK